MNTLRVDQIGLEDRWQSRLPRAWRLLRERGPRELWRLARQHGAQQCLEFAGRNLRYMLAIAVSKRFDRRHGVDTGGEIPSDHLEVVGEHGRQGAFFLSTPAWSFLRTLKSLPGDVGEFAFVDFGCGKGRILLLAAAAAKFHRVVGIEHAPALAAIANRNIETWRGPRQCAAVEAICADATTVEFPSEPCVFYFFAPFDRPVLEAVLGNVAASRRARPRRMHAIYMAAWDEPLPDELMRAAGFRRAPSPSPLPRFDPGASRRLQYAFYEAR
jgi:hypothetical protein